MKLRGVVLVVVVAVGSVGLLFAAYLLTRKRAS